MVIRDMIILGIVVQLSPQSDTVKGPDCRINPDKLFFIKTTLFCFLIL